MHFIPVPEEMPREEDVVVRGVWKGLEKGEMTGSAGCVSLQKSNRGEALDDEEARREIQFSSIQGSFFESNFSDLFLYMAYSMHFFSSTL